MESAVLIYVLLLSDNGEGYTYINAADFACWVSDVGRLLRNVMWGAWKGQIVESLLKKVE